MIETSDRRITPWVGRLLAINAIVLLLQQTIFTSETLARLIEFDSTHAAQRPWTFVTYMFMHGGLLHLAANSLALFVFGPTVERRFGSAAFIAYYLLCGVGAAAFSLALYTVAGIGDPRFVGASGAIVGVVYAYSRLLPDAELMIFPIPAPIKAKWLVWLLAAFDAIGLFFLSDNVAHQAHLGGLFFGIAYFVLRGIARPADPMPIAAVRPRVPVAARGGGSGQQPMMTTRTTSVAPAPSAVEEKGIDETVEIDRVLDKISATGIASLTADERRFLDSVASRRRNQH